MFSDCCDSPTVYAYVVDHVNAYFEFCPFAPYTGYLVLSFFMFLFFCFWRRANMRVKLLRNENKLLHELTDATGVSIGTDPLSEFENFNPKQVLDTIYSFQSSALSTIREMQSDAMHKLANSHELSLQQIQSIVDAFNDVDEQDE